MNGDELTARKSRADNERIGKGAISLMAACAGTNLGAVERLINEGADVNAVNEFADTALTQTIAYCRYTDEQKTIGLQIVTLLLDHGSDINLRNHDLTPVGLATVYRLADILKLLISRGADVNLPSSDGETPLLLATRLRSGKRIIKMLQNAGAIGGSSSDSIRKPIWGAKAPKIVREDEYEDMAATYQCLEIARLNEILKKNGIADVVLRRTICREYIFENGSFLDSGWLMSGDQTVWPELCFAARQSKGDGPVQTLNVTSESFSFHEYAGGDITWYFDEHGESIDEIEHGNV